MRISATIISAAAILLTCAAGRAQEAAAGSSDQKIPFDVRKTGVVNVVKDKDGKVTAIRLVVTSYEITLDEAGKQLETMDGSKVRVSGTFSFDDQNRRWITVKNVETIAAAKPAEAAPAAAAEPAPAAPAEPAEMEAAPVSKPEVKEEATPAPAAAPVDAPAAPAK